MYQAFMGEKIGDDILEDAYDSDAPRIAFAADLARWATHMEQGGWPLLVRMNIRDRGLLEMDIYEDGLPAN